MTSFPDTNGTDPIGRPSLRRQYVGDVAVDSGTLAIVDPAYIARLSSHFVADGDQLCEECCKVGDGAVLLTKFGDRLAVSLRHFGGDGIFPVYADRDDDGTITRVVIDLSRENSPQRPNARASDADESAILDGEQGVPALLRSVPDDFVEFAHKRITELLSVASEADALVESGDRVPTLYRRPGLQAHMFAAIGFPPHLYRDAQERRDSVVEQALHELLDAIAVDYALSDAAMQADLDEGGAIRVLRSSDVVVIPSDELDDIDEVAS